MGRRGPQPTPTAILAARGSWRAEVRDGEPSISPDSPACPEWLQPRARKYWAEIADMLAGLGVMGKPHTVALGLLVDAISDWIYWGGVCAKTKKTGAWTNKAKAWERVLKGCREFGASPAAITGVRSVKQDAPQEGLSSIRLAE